MNISQTKKYYPLIKQSQIIDQTNFAYSPQGTAFEKQIKKFQPMEKYKQKHCNL